MCSRALHIGVHTKRIKRDRVVKTGDCQDMAPWGIAYDLTWGLHVVRSCRLT